VASFPRSIITLWAFLFSPELSHVHRLLFDHVDSSRSEAHVPVAALVKPYMPIPVAAQSKVKVCGRALAGIVGSNPTGGTDVCLLYRVCIVR
jgi:hypothetical protein